MSRRDVGVILRDVSNSSCAECGVQMERPVEMSAVFTYHKDSSSFDWGYAVVVCEQCTKVHKKISDTVDDVEIRVKRLLDNWSQQEIYLMRHYGGNSQVNSIFERFYDHECAHIVPKPTSETLMAGRELFIRLKYQIFCFCDKNNKGDLCSSPLSKVFTRTRGSMKNAFNRGSFAENDPVVLPNRLLDFFCVVGMSNALTHYSRGILSKKSSESLLLEDISFEPKIVDTFPVSRSDATLCSQFEQFVFPEGVVLSTAEEPPKLFTFVLTGEDGVNTFGVALTIYDEVLTVKELQKLVSDILWKELAEKRNQEDVTLDNGTMSSWCESRGNAGKVFHVPKSLIIFSHYPFFNQMSEILRQTFRISLSDQAPLPIERYIQNFMNEVPLPPMGQVEISFSLIDNMMIKIKRSDEHHLPTINFSMRPLLSLLSPNNIMIIVGCLLSESRIVLYSSETSILNHVCQALIGLLFPFSFQGIFIPVVPCNMTEVMEAPVPFLIGMHSKYIYRIKPTERPAGVVFVDIDQDCVHLGYRDDGTFQKEHMPKLPTKAALKLRAFLDVYSRDLYIPTHDGRKGNVTTGSNESLSKDYIEFYGLCEEKDLVGSLDRETYLNNFGLAFPNHDHLIPVKVFVANGGMVTKKVNSPAVSIRKQVTRFQLQHQTSKVLNKIPKKVFKKRFSNKKNSVERNEMLVSEGKEDFSTPVRCSFLSFFVSILRKYNEYVDVKNGIASFNIDEFLAASKHLNSGCFEFITEFLQTQMFEQFVNSKISNPNQSVIKYFDEQIEQKLRSARGNVFKRQMTERILAKETTEQVSAIYTPLPPSAVDIPLNQSTFAYEKFPKLNPRLFGKEREPKRWSQNDGYCVNHRYVLHHQIMIPKIIKKILNDGLDRKDNEDCLWAAMMLSLPVLELEGLGGKKFFRRGTQKFNEADVISWIGSAATILSSNRSSRVTALPSIFVKDKIQDGSEVERNVDKNLRKKGFSIKRISQKDREHAASTVIQSRIRQHFEKKKLQLRRSAVKIQSLYRGAQVRIFSFGILNTVKRVQALFRGSWIRQKMLLERVKRIHEYREYIFTLWKQAEVSLFYRYFFWKSLRKGYSYFHLSLYEEEIKRLFTLSIATSNINNMIVSDDDVAILPSSSIYTKMKELKDVSSLQFTKSSETELQLKLERALLYDQLLSLDEEGRVNIFSLFGITGSNRKERLLKCEIWCKFDQASASFYTMSLLYKPIEDISKRTQQVVTHFRLQRKSRKRFRIKKSPSTFCIEVYDSSHRMKEALLITTQVLFQSIIEKDNHHLKPAYRGFMHEKSLLSDSNNVCMFSNNRERFSAML